MDIKIPEEAEEILGERGIKAKDVKDIISTAESTGKKLTHEEEPKILAKKVLGDTTVYAEYHMDGNAAVVDTAYAHRIALGDTVNEFGSAGWRCENCREKAVEGHVEMSYMDVTRNGPAIICPKCQDSWAEEYLATGTMAAVEGLFEKKRA